MAQEFSFDVVSKVDPQAVQDAVNISNKEMQNRFDFKGSMSRIDFDRGALTLTLLSDDEGKLKSVADILRTRLAKRGVPLKNLDEGRVESAAGGTARQVIKVQQGIPSEKAKAMVAEIKGAKLKVQSQIQGDQVRVSSRSKDDLQSAISLLKSKDFGLDLQFVNYRGR